MTAAFDAIWETALAWHRDGNGAVLATVVQTWGSAPRPVGAGMVMNRQGGMVGSVSGGCVEGAVVAEAAAALDSGTPALLEYGVSDDDAFAVGLACGGTIRVLLEPVTDGPIATILADIVAARARRAPVAYVVDTATFERRLEGPEAYPDRFRGDKSGFEDDGTTFVAIHNPPLRLAVVGAVHIAQPLVAMAKLAGYDVTLIDPRDAFGSAARFPGETISNDWPDEALEALGLDARTAVVTLTHDPKLDDPALGVALLSPAFYVGALGSTRTHAKRVDRLLAAGIDAAAIERLHAPVGLGIGAKSPAEIAVSILAEITDVLRRGA